MRPTRARAGAGAAWWPALLASASLAILPIDAAAQRQCAASARVGWIGITGIECSNCTIAFPGNGRTSHFSTEPVIADIAPGSPAAGELEPGDVLVSVNGSLITSNEGMFKFSNLKPGQNLVLIIRRDGEQMLKRFGMLPGKCPNDPLVLGSGAPQGEAPVTPAPPGVGLRTRPAPPPGRRAPTTVAPPRAEATSPAFDGAPQGVAFAQSMLQPRASFGFGIACTDCLLYRRNDDRDGPIVWEFGSPPEVYSVETDGPAYRAGLRRGDLITHIDGHPITRDEAGRRFAAADAGETLRFTYRRGSQTRTVSVRAEPRANAARSSQEAGSALRRAQQMLEDITRRERTEHAQLLRELARLTDEQLATARDRLDRYVRNQLAEHERLTEVQERLNEAEARLQQETTASNRAQVRRGTSTYTVLPSSRVIRYSGRLADTDIEVRGGPNVVVNENAEEIIITSGETTIRLRKR